MYNIVLVQDPNNSKIKELHDFLYESISQQYALTQDINSINNTEQEMDPHMKLNKDGEYEYMDSDSESN